VDVEGEVEGAEEADLADMVDLAEAEEVEVEEGEVGDTVDLVVVGEADMEEVCCRLSKHSSSINLFYRKIWSRRRRSTWSQPRCGSSSPSCSSRCLDNERRDTAEWHVEVRS
jgi:hypothetical protein